MPLPKTIEKLVTCYVPVNVRTACVFFRYLAAIKENSLNLNLPSPSITLRAATIPHKSGSRSFFQWHLLLYISNVFPGRTIKCWTPFDKLQQILFCYPSPQQGEGLVSSLTSEAVKHKETIVKTASNALNLNVSLDKMPRLIRESHLTGPADRGNGKSVWDVWRRRKRGTLE